MTEVTEKKQIIDTGIVTQSNHFTYCTFLHSEMANFKAGGGSLSPKLCIVADDAPAKADAKPAAKKEE